jgi:hypothetical protein
LFEQDTSQRPLAWRHHIIQYQNALESQSKQTGVSGRNCGHPG